MRNPDGVFVSMLSVEVIGALPSEIIFVDDRWEKVRADGETEIRGVHCRGIGESPRLVGKMLWVQGDEEKIGSHQIIYPKATI